LKYEVPAKNSDEGPDDSRREKQFGFWEEGMKHGTNSRELGSAIIGEAVWWETRPEICAQQCGKR
jgi:hypothetical protein